MSLKKPTFEFFFSQEDANKTSTKYPHYVYNYRTQKWVSIFEYLGFLKTYKFTKDIVKIFKMIKAKQNQNYWKKYYKTFKNWENKKSDSKITSKLLIDISSK